MTKKLSSARDRGLISVITPAYNAAAFVAKSIQSVQEQTYQNWEMLVVDDGSTDETSKIVQEFCNNDPRIQLFRLEKNEGPAKGPATARNFALKKASGQYIAFLDSDDLWLPEKLESQLSFLKERDGAFCYSSYRRINAEDQLIGPPVSVPSSIQYHRLLKHNVIATLTVLIDREQVGEIEMVNEGYDDFILWLSLLRKGFTGYGSPQVLAHYRDVGGSVSSKKTRAAKWVWHIYRNVEKLSLPYAMWCFANYVFRVSTKRFLY